MEATWSFQESLLEKGKGWNLDRRAFELSVMGEQKNWLSKWPGNWLSE
jgi:hypothetical protein